MSGIVTFESASARPQLDRGNCQVVDETRCLLALCTHRRTNLNNLAHTSVDRAPGSYSIGCDPQGRTTHLGVEYPAAARVYGRPFDIW